MLLTPFIIVDINELKAEHIKPSFLFYFTDTCFFETFIQFNSAAGKNIIISAWFLPVD